MSSSRPKIYLGVCLVVLGAGVWAEEEFAVQLPAVLERASANPFEKLQGPVASKSGRPEIYGTYSKGCARGLVAVEKTTADWEVVNVYRRAYYAHPEMARVFAEVSRWAAREAGIGKLIVGDFSLPAGGPMTYGHASHQIGLDADIYFNLYSLNKTMPEEVRETFPDIDVANPAEGMTSEWRKDYARLLERFASQPQVERIFVNPQIKKHICETYRAGNHPDWLRKLRPTNGHTAHFHVRLRCPTDSEGCVKQAPVAADDPTGVGCGRSTASSDPESGQRMPSQEGIEPWWKSILRQLPKACHRLLVE